MTLTDARDKDAVSTATAFDQVESELMQTVRRLAELDDPPLLRSRPELRGFEQLNTFAIEETDCVSTGRLTRAALERARDFCSDVALFVNANAPSGVRALDRRLPLHARQREHVRARSPRGALGDRP